MVPLLNQSKSYAKSISWNTFSVGGCGRGLWVIMTYRMRSQILLVKFRFLSGKKAEPIGRYKVRSLDIIEVLEVRACAL